MRLAITDGAARRSRAAAEKLSTPGDAYERIDIQQIVHLVFRRGDDYHVNRLLSMLTICPGVRNVGVQSHHWRSRGRCSGRRPGTKPADETVVGECPEGTPDLVDPRSGERTRGTSRMERYAGCGPGCQADADRRPDRTASRGAFRARDEGAGQSAKAGRVPTSKWAGRPRGLAPLLRSPCRKKSFRTMPAAASSFAAGRSA